MVDKKQDVKMSQLYSLRTACKQRIKSTFFQLRKENKGVQSFLMVVDQKSLKMISSFLNQMELLDLDIMAVELLENERKSYQNQHAIYIITPTEESVNNLLEDFKSKNDFQYGVAHLLLTNKISKDLMQKIANCEFLLKRLKTFKEFNQDFSCKFDNFFNLDMPEALSILYSDPIGPNNLSKDTARNDQIKIQQTIDQIAGKLTTVITSLEKFYAVEIIYNQKDNMISQKIAEAVQQRLKEVTDNIGKDNTDVFDPNSGKVTLIIVDRSIDITSPLVRDFHYQPLMYDLLDIKNDIVSYDIETNDGKQIPTKAKLEDNDEVFSRYRYKFWPEVLQGIPSELVAFCNTNDTAKLKQGDLADLDLSKMSQVIKGMPQYKEQSKRLNMHIQLLNDCQKKIDTKGLTDLGELEQTIVTGTDAAGKSVSAKDIMRFIGKYLNSTNLTPEDNLRLALLSIMNLELAEKNRKDITDKLRTEDLKAIQNIVLLGITPQSASQKKQDKSKQKIEKKMKELALTKSHSISLCRYITALEALLFDLVENNQYDQVFSELPPNYGQIRMFTEKLSGKRQKTSKIIQKKKISQLVGDEDTQEITNQMPKLVVFVVGGISHTEVRGLRNLEELQDKVCLIGGSSLLRPKDFVEFLKSMN